MLRTLAIPVRVVRWIARPFRRRPWTASVVLLLLVVGTVSSVGYVYVRHQWKEAQADIREMRLDDARRRLDFCLAVWPRRVDVRLLAARAARLSGEFEVAEAHLNECLKLSGGATEDIQVEFLLMRAQTGEVEEVAPLLEIFVENGHREGSLILETLARTYMHHLEYGPAYRCLNRWIALKPEESKPYYWRGWVLERVSNPAHARLDYERALALDPDVYQVRLRLAEILLEDHHPQEAVVHLEYLWARHAGRPEVQARLGQCRFVQGRMPEARELLTAAAEHMPEDLPLLLHLARLDLLDKRPDVAEARLRKILTVDPAYTEAEYTLALVLRAQRREAEGVAMMAQYDQHKAILDRANKLLSEEGEKPTATPEVPHEIGTLLLQLQKDRLALHWLNQALARNPNHRPTHQALAEYFERTGDLESAASHRRKLPK